MKYTENLKLPIFDNPSEDLFKVSDWNEANENIEATLTEIKDWKDNVVSEVLKDNGGIILLSENGTKFKITVSNDGTLKTTQIT